MYRQIFTLEQQIPGFNKTCFDFSDFRNLCDQQNIRLYYWDFPEEIKGIYINIDFPIIGLNNTLCQPEKEIVAFQELGHYYLHHHNSFTIERATSFLPKIEYEAAVFAALCLIPAPILETSQDEILSHYPVDFRTFRMRIYNNYCKQKQRKV